MISKKDDNQAYDKITLSNLQGGSMTYLIATTLIWAFSFSLIGNYISGAIDNYFAILTRFVLALLVFLPFMKFRGANIKLAAKIAGIGSLQIGIMYLFYYNSFLYLSVAEVALFTIFTPFYVSLFYDIAAKRFRALYLISVAIGIYGAFVIRYNGIDWNFLTGFLLIQGANIVFALGQSLFKIVAEKDPQAAEKKYFGYFYVGGICVAMIAFAFLGDFSKLPTTSLQWGILVYLGVIASAVGYFLWNVGAYKVDSGVLAIMNNAVIPAAIIVNIVFWGKGADLERLAIGTAIMFIALFIHYRIIKYYANQKIKLQ